VKTLHHLLRVRMRTARFQQLQEIAERESKDSGNYISVSDIVRIAIDNWLQTYNSTQLLQEALEKINKEEEKN